MTDWTLIAVWLGLALGALVFFGLLIQALRADVFDLRAMISEARAEERERCIRAAEGIADQYERKYKSQEAADGARAVADEIRSLK